MKTKKIISIALAAAMVGTLISPSFFTSAANSNTPTETQMVLWYDEPASSTNSSDTWQQATLPIGNGILGANVYGELATEHLTLNEETLWSGGRVSVDHYNGGNPSDSKVEVYNSLSNYYLNGTSTEYTVEDLKGVEQDKSGYNYGYQALGDLYLNFENAPSSTPSDYVRMLDLENGISTVSYTNNDVEYTRTYFASNPDNVIVAHLTASGEGNLDFTTSIDSQQTATITASVDGAAEAEEIMLSEPVVEEESAAEEEAPAEEEPAAEEEAPAEEEPAVEEEAPAEEEPAVEEEAPAEEEEPATEEEAPIEEITVEETPAEEAKVKLIDPFIVGSSQTSDAAQRGMIVCSGTVSNNGLLHNTQIVIVSDSGTMTANGDGSITINDANEVTIYLTAATDYKNTFYDAAQKIEYYYRTGETADALNTRVQKALVAAADKGYDAVLASHQADYQELYNRVALDLGQSSSKPTNDLLSAYKNGDVTAEEQRFLEVLMFQYGRYLLIAGSRENSQLPTTLQGIWNNSNEAPWYSDIHTNINEQMNYWLSNNCNLTECALPLVNYMANLEIPGGRTVEIYTGSTYGIMAHTQNTPYGYTSPGYSIGTWGWSPAAATWLLQNCYDYYEYSGDTDTLRETIYPVLREQVLMYQDLLKEKDGRMVMPITQSPELATITAGNTYEQSIIWQLYADTIEAANILGLDDDQIATWQEMMDKLNPIEIGTSGQVKEWYHETSLNSVNDTRGHRHLSNLLGLYPGNLFDTEEELDAAIVSLNNKNFGRVGTSNNPDGGWTYGQLINSWARVGDGENAYYSISQLLKNKVFDNLWDYHDGSAGSYGLFQIDANYGYSAGVGEMLLQSNLGYIHALPAIPDEWAAGSVDGLLAEGGFEVDMDWSEGTLDTIVITSKNGGNCSVKGIENKTLEITDTSGNAVEYTIEDGIYTFATTKDASYTVTVIEPETFAVNAVRNTDKSVTVTWESKEGVTYTITRKTVTK